MVVHGVTIPIGKGLTLAHSRTLTLTRSQNGLTEPADRVSRLPAPLPFGSDALRSQAENTVAESKNRNDLGPSIRFDLNEEGGNESPRKGKSNGIMTESSTPSHSSSRPSTPPQMKKDRLGDAGHDDDRDTPAEIEQGESWVEGDNVVIESDDGEDVRVEPRRGTN